MNYFEVNCYLKKYDQILCTMLNEMLLPYESCSITLYFIQGMIPHHEGAIKMCENLLTYSNHSKLQEMAQEMIQKQTSQIEIMRKIATTTSYIESNLNEFNKYRSCFLEVTHQMGNRMKMACRSNDIHLNFINEMIPHHEGAIKMCKNLIKYSIDERLEKLAREIIEEESQGIIELGKMRNEICY